MRQQLGPGPAGPPQPSASAGCGAHPVRAVDRAGAAEARAPRGTTAAWPGRSSRGRPSCAGAPGRWRPARRRRAAPAASVSGPASSSSTRCPGRSASRAGQRAPGRARAHHDGVERAVRCRTHGQWATSGRMHPMSDLVQDLADFVTAAPDAVPRGGRGRPPAGRGRVRRAAGGRRLVRRARRPLPDPRRHHPGLVPAAGGPARHPDADLRRAHRLADAQGQAAPGRRRGRVAAGRGGGLRRGAVELLAGPRPRPGRAARALRRHDRAGRRAPAAAAGARSWPSTSTARSTPSGLHLDAQQHLLPIWGLGTPTEGDLVEFLAAEAGVDPAEVAAHDLVVHDVTPPARLGARRELLAAPRLDNLASVHAGIGGAARRGRATSTARP